MALFSLRVRRALSSLSTAHRSLCAVPAVSAAPAPAPGSLSGSSPSWRALSPAMVQSRLFRSSAINLLSNQSRFNSDDLDKIDPDTILFEGCDYNHWLITMDFPKDPRPSPEEMVRTYEETCAKGLKISLEEAKQRMYACSTTTYQGFQAVMTEAESEQFRGLPGVVFILPDSYIDPQNKEYGGDKYENGMITPRPPPIQYGRQVRNRDRNRNFDQPRYERQGVGPVPNRQGNPQFDSQGQMQRDGRNYGPPQNYPPQQNYGPQGQSETRNPMPVNNYGPPGRDSYQADRREPPPSYQGNYNQMGQNNNYYNQERRDMPRGDGRNYAPPVQNDFVGNNRSYPPPQGGSFGQSPNGYQGQGAGGTYGQGTGSYGQGTGGTYGQGAGPYGPGTGGKYGQGTGGTHGQGTGSYGQGTSSYGMGYTQAEERNMQQGDQKEHGTGGQMGTDQRRY